MRTNLKSFYVFVFIGVMLLLAACDRPTSIARVGNYTILLQELETLTAGSRKPSNTLPLVLEHVNTLVENKLKLMDAYSAGLDQDSIVIAGSADAEHRHVYSYVIEKNVIEKVITDQRIRERYQQRSKEWHARHIFVRAGRDSVESRELLMSLRSRILRGEDFEALAREYSKDTQSAGKGGDLGFITWDSKEWGKEFLQELKKLHRGQISQVFRSKRGYHLVKLEKVRNVSLPPFKEEKENIKKSFYSEYKQELDSTYFSFRGELEEYYDAIILEENIDSLLLFIKAKEAEFVEKKLNMRRDPKQFFGVLMEEEKNFQLATFNQGTYTFEDMLTTYNKISAMRRPAFRAKADVQEFLNRNVPRKLIAKYGYEKGYENNADVKKSVKDDKEKLMIRRIRRERVDSRVEISEQELLDQYNNNLHFYEDGALVNVQEIVIADSVVAQEVYDRAVRGEDFADLAATFNEREETKENNGVLGFLTRRDQGVVGRRAIRLKAGEIAEPQIVEKRYSIIKILERKAGEQKSFANVRSRIRREMKNDLRQRLQKEWMLSLREQYPVVVYTGVIKKEFGFLDD